MIRELEENKVVIIVVLLSIAIFFYGFDSKDSLVKRCDSTYSKYVVANYSETTMAIDMDGNVYSDYDSWTEPASDVFRVITVNGVLNGQSDVFEVIKNGDYYLPKNMPPHDQAMKRERDFDNFSFLSKSNLEIYIYSENGGHDKFNEPISDTSLCISKIDQYVVVKTWYSISYSSDFKS